MNRIIISIVLIGLVSGGCQKYLDKKPDSALKVPSTIEDMQALLDNNYSMNMQRNNCMGEGSADNYYLTDAAWSSLNQMSDKSIYRWDEELFYDNNPGQNDWLSINTAINIANTVLQTGETISTKTEDWNKAMGSAYFFRSFYQFTLALNFAKAFDESTADEDLGIPLRLTPDFNKPSVRSTVRQTYEQILKDATLAARLLPVSTGHVMRPSKPAGFALLSRIYLSMRNYEQAGAYADSCLQLKDDLLNYNDIAAGSSAPFPKFNAEVIFHTQGFLYPLYVTMGKIDSLLVQTYETGDLRKTLFFSDNGDGSKGFIGNYTGDYMMFTGLATDEMFLTRAECKARTQHIEGALDDLNTLLQTRWSGYTPFTNTNPQAVLDKILLERRKQLLLRDLRWMDVKRLNKEGAGIVLQRKLLGQTYQLQPNDNRYALPLPINIVQLSGMPQNPR